MTGVTIVGVHGHLDAEPSAEDSAILQTLMNADHGRPRGVHGLSGSKSGSKPNRSADIVKSP